MRNEKSRYDLQSVLYYYYYYYYYVVVITR